MSPAKPDAKDVTTAIDIFLRHAYGGSLPLSVKSQLAVLKSWTGPLFSAPVFVPNAKDNPSKYFIRFGNKNYPHMKLVIEESPDGSRWLFRADSHDRHLCPPANAPDYSDFSHLMESNQQMVEKIESDWMQHSLPTFKAYLREDLARRQSGASL